MTISQQDPVSSGGAGNQYRSTVARKPRPRGSNPVGWILGAIVLVVLVTAGLTIPPGAPAHQAWAAATGALAQREAGSPEAAIQAVIQRANQEQAQALASANPSVMSDTATAAYYRQLVQTNQQLAAQGATSLQLTQLTWGPIAVNGNTATATTTETWITTFSDGTTDESTDTNVYTLVLQNGTWVIEADQQPAAATSRGGQPPASAQPTPQAPLPAVPAGESTSHNWSGYAATSGRFTGVTGTWTVPQPSLSGAGGVGATWVGIGGVTSRDLIQAGTQDVSNGSGQAEFQAWIETLPQASQQVPLAVVPGDSVTVSIQEQGAGSGMWQVSITNNTSGQSYQTTVQYTSSESSAEWIVEAPASSGGILPLDSFSSVAFSGASATMNGQTVDLTTAGARPITMLNATNQPLAVPSQVESGGASFTVTRTSAAATMQPIPGTGRAPGRGGR